MSQRNPFNTLLAPTDFSESSRRAFEWAIQSVEGDDAAVIVLHVLDQEIIDTIAAHEFASHDEVADRMRRRADEQIAEYRDAGNDQVEVDALIVEGRPFLEIVRKADDFAVDGIVLSGQRDKFEKLLFGSTVEKVLRGSRRPIIVLPDSGD